MTFTMTLISSMAFAAPLDLATLAGVYKHRFPNGDVNGGTWISEDILEIVPLSPTTAYFKIHTEFYNGHQCAIHGIADVQDDSLVYVDRSDNVTEGEQRCVLELSSTPTTIAFDDDGTCKGYCGVRGSFRGTEVDRTTRRTIRYLKLLKGSADFRQAIEEHARPIPTLPAMP